MKLKKFIIITEIKKDTSINSFLAVREETSSPVEINFSIVKLIDNVNKQDSINFDVNDELSDFTNDNVQQQIQRASESGSFREKTIDSRRPGRRRREHKDARQVSKKPTFLSG